MAVGYDTRQRRHRSLAHRAGVAVLFRIGRAERWNSTRGLLRRARASGCTLDWQKLGSLGLASTFDKMQAERLLQSRGLAAMATSVGVTVAADPPLAQFARGGQTWTSFETAAQMRNVISRCLDTYIKRSCALGTSSSSNSAWSLQKMHASWAIGSTSLAEAE